MNKVLTALIFSICLNQHASAQTKVDQTQTASTANQTQKIATTQPPELAEANRLSVDVVKLFAEKKYDEALPLAQRALELREKALGQDHDLVGEALYNLANVYLVKKKYNESEPLFHRLLPIYEKRYGKDDLKLCQVLDNYAIALLFKGKLKEAESQLERASNIRATILGGTSIEVARTTFRLGEFHRVTGRYAEAALNYRNVIENRRLAFGLKRSDENDADDDKTATVLPCLDVMKVHQKEAMEILSRPDVPQPNRNSDKSDAREDADPATKNVKGGVLNGKAISKPTPEYPLEAKRAGITGTIPVIIKVDETGKVIKARAFCGDPSLAKASVNAARRVRFSPTLLSGVPVKVTGIITFNFTLQYH